jgi:hypothetical protein
VGITTETDPQVGTNYLNYVPRWNGSNLTSGTIYDNGNIGIGTTNPQKKLDIDLGDLLVQGVGSFDAAGEEAIVNLGSIHHYIKGVHGFGVKIGTSVTGGDVISIREGSGNVDINTVSPTEKLHITGHLRLDGDLKTDRWLGSDTNTFIGVGVVGAGNLNHTGVLDGWYNTALGGKALYYNTTGVYNTAVGHEALYSNTTGCGNTAVGRAALPDNTTGYFNTAVGESAGYNSLGSGDVFLGYGLLTLLTQIIYSAEYGVSAG